VRALDVLHLVDRDEHAALMVDAGFDARLVRDASRELKNVLGALAYVASGLRHTIGLRDQELEIELDGESHTMTGHSVFCLNVGRIGEVVVVDEEIEPDDGELHVGVVRRSTPWQVLLTAGGMVALGRDAHPNVQWLRGRRLRIDGEAGLQLQVDGDPAGTTPVEVELLPAAVDVAVPTGSW
jgi:diacylglycerol kinase family enzyme